MCVCEGVKVCECVCVCEGVCVCLCMHVLYLCVHMLAYMRLCDVCAWVDARVCM